jgi:DNA ligase (NAD+)
MMQQIAAWGVPVSPWLRRCDGLAAMVEHYRSIQAERVDLPYEIDGVVYKVDDFTLQDRLGFVAKAPAGPLRASFPPNVPKPRWRPSIFRWAARAS